MAINFSAILNKLLTNPATYVAGYKLFETNTGKHTVITINNFTTLSWVSFGKPFSQDEWYHQGFGDIIALPVQILYPNKSTILSVFSNKAGGAIDFMVNDLKENKSHEARAAFRSKPKDGKPGGTTSINCDNNPKNNTLKAFYDKTIDYVDFPKKDFVAVGDNVMMTMISGQAGGQITTFDITFYDADISNSG